MTRHEGRFLRNTAKPKKAELAPDSARNQLVKEHLHLVDRIAGGMMKSIPPHMDLDDLKQVGTLGLMDAADRFDSSPGVPFEQYATIKIRGAIGDYLREEDPLGRNHRMIEKQVAKAREELTRAAPGENVSMTQAFAAAGLSAEQQRNFSNMPKSAPVPLDQPLPNGSTIADTTPGEYIDFGERLDLLELQTALKNAKISDITSLKPMSELIHPLLEGLSQREIYILKERVEGTKKADIAAKLDVDPTRLSQLITIINGKLSDNRSNQGIPSFTNKLP